MHTHTPALLVCTCAAVSVLETCGDGVCDVGEFTSKYTCLDDCAVFEVSFYFELDLNIFSQDDVARTLRINNTVFGSNIIVSPSIGTGRVMVTVTTRVQQTAN